MRVALWLLPVLAIGGCELGGDGPVDGTRGGLSGNVSYFALLTTQEGRVGGEWRPVRGVAVELLQADEVIGTTETDAQGHYAFSAALPSTGVTARAIAKATGPRIDIVVHKSDLSLPPWSASTAGPSYDIAIEESYAAGAFHIVQLMYRVADALEGLVAEDPPERLVVRWQDSLTPGCGSCFYSSENQLDIGGTEGEEDAWDDSVILHELGHFTEAAWGHYSNPGGLHDLEYVAPTLAWSEGFATWFASVLRDDPIYVDVQPWRVYVLDMENPPEASLGTGGGTTISKHSEALVYGLLWDLVDGGDDDDEAATFPLPGALAAVVGLLEASPDLGVSGADLLDWLNDWRCITPDADAELQGLVDAFQYPYDTGTAPTCAQ